MIGDVIDCEGTHPMTGETFTHRARIIGESDGNYAGARHCLTVEWIEGPLDGETADITASGDDRGTDHSQD